MKPLDFKEEVIEGLTDGFWHLNEGSPSLNVSQSFWSLLGIDYALDEIHLDQVTKYVFYDDRQTLESVLDWNQSFVQTESRIIRFLHADGRWVWFEIKIKDLQNSIGKKRALLFFDISCTKERERVYNEFDSINNTGGWCVDIAEKQLHWTPFVYKIYGLEEGNLPGLDDSINFYKEGESRSRISYLFNKSVEEGTDFDEEFEFVDAKGVTKWVRSRGKPVMENGECKMVYGTIQDITEDKLKNQALDASRRQFEDVFNSTFQFCGILESDGTMLAANNTALEFAGLSANDVIGRKFWEAFWWQNSEDNQQRLKQAIKRAAAGEFVRYNVKVWDKNKNEITIDFNLKPMKDGSDKAKRLIAEGRLIQDLVDAQQALDEMIGKVTRQNETLKNFAHIVSHNMRSHASNISLLTDILNESKTENPSAQTIEMLREASHQLTETLGHVSDVVVIHTSEEENYCEINLYDAAERSLASISALISLADADVKLDIPEDLRVHGIPAYVDSIFLNLLSNSVKYKSIDRKLEISVKASKDKSMIKVSFTDNGMGIDLEKYGSKLFRMYKTFHGNEDARGIGLFLTKNQVESMGGQIEVDSVVGKQTTFDIYLPIV